MKRIAIIGIFIYDASAVSTVNALLHEFAEIIVARMGLPYRERGVNVITLIADGNNDEIGSLSGKLGQIRDVAVKTSYAKQ